ncbi:MAG: N-acetylglucosamine-6-phosphate deacetylase [Bacillota bacterium]
MRILTIASERIYTGEGEPFRGYITVVGSSIDSVNEGEPDPADEDLGEVLDFGSARVIPGLIDLHVHGAGGHDADAPLSEMARFLARNGVTAFQPTVGAAPVPAMESTISKVRDLLLRREPLPAAGKSPGKPGRLGQSSGLGQSVQSGRSSLPRGAKFLGLHLEGPFLNPARNGAIPRDCLLPPDLRLMKRWVEMGEGIVGHVTLAPELAGSLQVINYLVQSGVTVSLGHTDATYDQMIEGFRAGATVVTHTFNAMRGLHHREPGPVGAALTDDDAYCELIADGIHVHEAAMRLLLRAKGVDRVCLVSDALPMAGLNPGRYEFLGQEISLDESGRCLLSDGTLAGSTAMLKDGLRVVAGQLGVPFEAALRMATVNPAKIAGVWERKGSLTEEKDADIVVLDASFRVLFSMVEGEVQVNEAK